MMASIIRDIYRLCYIGVTEKTLMIQERLVQLNVRVPRTLKRLMKKCIELDTHKDLSEFTRDALREKINRDAPNLYQELFQGEKTSR
jgi:hypothetical protein